MQSFSAAQLVEVWERGLGQPLVERALTILAVGYPEMTGAELTALSVGERDRRLLALRERLFGKVLKSFAECPRCASSLEFSLDVNELRTRHSIGTAPLSAELISATFDCGCARSIAPIFSAAAACPDVESARRMLLERAVSKRNTTRKILPPPTCPPSARAA